MQTFYTALENIGVGVNDITNIITPAFQTNRIIPGVLSTLTDAELERIGIAELGLRKAIIKVLGKE